MRHARTTPMSVATVANASIMSNMVSVVVTAQNALANSTSGAARPAPACGHKSRPRRAAANSNPSAKAGESRRGHHSLTPKTAQPACMSQKRSGGLWE